MYTEFAKGELARIVGIKNKEGLTDKSGKAVNNNLSKDDSKLTEIESAEADI